ncbi:MAG TPA: flagellar motor switch protein FliM [Jatrophihabitans sp.]|nr:flagellar motor switch protein FliM [Jatrophihabitans sp.]
MALTRATSLASVRRLTRQSAESSGDGVVPYDFRRPTKLTRDHIRALQMSYETFARRLTTLLTSGLRQLCQVSLIAIEHQSYEEYIANVAGPTILSVLDMGGLPGTALFEFSVPTALACVDYLLGGQGGEQPVRQLTDLETSLLRNLIEQMLSVLRYALEPTVGAEPSLRTIEFNPQFVQAAGATDSVVVGSFQMKVGNQTCVSTLCIPFASLAPRLQDGKDRKSQSPAERAASMLSAAHVRKALGGVPVQVALTFEPVTLTPAQIISLAPGDVVPLRHRVTAPLAVESGGVVFAHALAGRQGSRLAGLVVSKDGSTKHGASTHKENMS